MSIFKILWAPWRKEYITKKEKDCFICKKLEDDPQNDRENLILLRGKNTFCMLNLYPYNNGHLLIGPKRHIGDINSLNDEEIIEIWRVASKMIDIIKKEMNADGFNLGFNLGKVAGAGLEEHLHLHLVPRWSGDTNFLPVLSGTKVISEDLKSVYDRLRRYLE